jgi:hypothetical protein
LTKFKEKGDLLVTSPVIGGFNKFSVAKDIFEKNNYKKIKVLGLQF